MIHLATHKCSDNCGSDNELALRINTKQKLSMIHSAICLFRPAVTITLRGTDRCTDNTFKPSGNCRLRL